MTKYLLTVSCMLILCFGSADAGSTCGAVGGHLPPAQAQPMDTTAASTAATPNWERLLLGLACVLTAGMLFVFVWKRWHVLDEHHPPDPRHDPPDTGGRAS